MLDTFVWVVGFLDFFLNFLYLSSSWSPLDKVKEEGHFRVNFILLETNSAMLLRAFPEK